MPFRIESLHKRDEIARMRLLPGGIPAENKLQKRIGKRNNCISYQIVAAMQIFY